MTNKSHPNRPIIQNRKAKFRYEILDRIECGLVLQGTEVKSLRAGGGSLEEAFACVEGGAVWLRGFHIPPYTHGNVQNHDPLRRRKLLLHKREIGKLAPKVAVRGLTLVPLEVYFNDRGIAKVTLGLARGKAMGDKRQDMKKRDAQREMDRAMKRRR